MKKLLTILVLLFSMTAYSQTGITYVVDTIAYDTVTLNPIIGGIVKLNTVGSLNTPIYEVKADGVIVYLIYKVIAVNVGTMTLQVKGFYLSKNDYPDVWNYLTSSTVRNTLSNILQAYFNGNPVNWSEFINIQQE